MPDNPNKQPGDAIIDFYMPDASPDERAEALTNLRNFMGVLCRVPLRNADTLPTSDSRKSRTQDRIPSLPQDP